MILTTVQELTPDQVAAIHRAVASLPGTAGVVASAVVSISVTLFAVYRARKPGRDELRSRVIVLEEQLRGLMDAARSKSET